MNMVKPGPIWRKGTFLWQEDTPSGSGINLWSGMLYANNGYPDSHALKAAALFEAAPSLLEAAEEALGVLNGAEHALPAYVVAMLERAIAKAEGQS